VFVGTLADLIVRTFDFVRPLSYHLSIGRSMEVAGISHGYGLTHCESTRAGWLVPLTMSDEIQLTHEINFHTVQPRRLSVYYQMQRLDSAVVISYMFLPNTMVVFDMTFVSKA